MEIVKIKAHPKEGSGKEAAKKVRRAGQVPAVMYKSGGTGEPMHFSIEIGDYRSLVYTSKFKLAEVEVDGKTHKCILKDIQFHPVTDAVIHVDFLELAPGVKFKATVPVVFTGTAPGVKNGGKFLPKLRGVRILTTPEYVVDHVEADISTMELGSTIRVRDINKTNGVDIINNGAVPIASIEIPRALRQQQGK
ncbi:MAG: 50S ribosomal protein L25 [Saprospiraceae bacterium]|nr:50S ribosomal protein L25 [Saprospiraceae bacterium]